MSVLESDEQPRKRVKLSGPEGIVPTESASLDSAAQEQLDKEFRAGIRAYVSPESAGFSGILKQRYTDFCVNEVLSSGQVLHLESLDVPKSEVAAQAENASNNDEMKAQGGQGATSAPAGQELPPDDARKDAKPEISSEDKGLLLSIFGEETATRAIALYKAVLKKPDRKPRDFDPVFSRSINDKEARTTAHQTIRRIFAGRLDTSTEADNTFRIVPAAIGNKNQKYARNHGKGQPKGKLGWDQLGGQYLHFTLLKENRDTMEVIGYLASQLKVKPKDFGFAGTKDRRGVTAQRVSAYRMHAQRFAQLTRGLRGSWIGGYEYSPTRLELGDLGGNEFEIALRDCRFPDADGLSSTQLLEHAEKIVGEAVRNLQENGYINYYGLQRFGSFASSTDQVGVKLLQEDLKGATDCILDYSPAALEAAQNPGSKTALISSEDKARAAAIHTWQTTHNAEEALEILPRKFSAEREIIRHLGWVDRHTKERPRSGDYQGALTNIPRNLRLMYVHAYQSYVWNIVAGKRWETFGNKTVEGDLVIVGEKSTDEKETQPAAAEFDEDGEPIIRPAATDSAAATSFVRARPLSRHEAESGKYNIFDVVLPLPGWDVVYPSNAIGEFYVHFMGSEEGGKLNPHSMRRKWKDISLSGSYRKFISKPAEGMTFKIKEYWGEAEQLIETDADRLKLSELRKEAEESMTDAKKESKIAVILKFQLGSSQYATMALRELMKAGGVRTYQAEYLAR